MKKAKVLLTSISVFFMLTSFSCQSSMPIENSDETESSEQIETDVKQDVKKETISFEEEEELLKESEGIKRIDFGEIWGYVMIGREAEFSLKYPITDVGYFCDAVNVFSEMPSVPPRSKFFKKYKGRVHLVTSVDSKSQTHLLLQPDLPLRDRIIDQMVNAAKTYDGLQIDWESVPKEDDENFWEFLRLIKEKLGGKPLTMAIPARTRTLERDAYNYAKLSEIADRIIIMAYDEHWSTSKPGAIASTDWCKRIAEYTKTQIPEEKLIMGLSFYGRTWMTASVRAQAWYNSGIERIKREQGVAEISRDSYGTPHFTFKEEVTITAWYDDIDSLKIRAKMYSDLGIKKIAFWRVGQENSEFWKYLGIGR
ncbi:MAG: glycoside hydrolase [Treponema sp.]|nr:glycoside hydrolase [Treponema sp.]